MQDVFCCFPAFSLLTGRISFFWLSPVTFAAATWLHSACRWQESVGDQVLVALATLPWLCAAQDVQGDLPSTRAGLAGFSCSRHLIQRMGEIWSYFLDFSSESTHP